MAVPTVLIVILTVLATLVFLTIIAGIILISRLAKRRRNPIDICILELTKNGIQIRNEIGRREFVKDKGYRTVTEYKWRKGIKDNLGYNINDDDLYLSMMGRSRKYLLLAMKDKLVSNFKNAIKSIDWTDKEKEILIKIKTRLGEKTPVKIDEIPENLSLSPLLAEQTRFRLDVEKDKNDVYRIDERAMARRILYASAGIFVLTLVVSLVIFILVINQAPEMAAKQAATIAQTTSTQIPLLPG